MTMFGVAALTAPVVGPTLGGYITVNYNWRWIFLHQPPDRRPRLPDVPLRGPTTPNTSSRSGRSCGAGRSTSTTSAWGCSP